VLFGLNQLASTCVAQGFEHEFISDTELAVCILPDRYLLFVNSPEEGDCSAGFRGFPWHFHGELMLMCTADTYQIYPPAHLLTALRSGDVFVAERTCDGVARDVWLTGQADLDFSHLEPGEVVTLHRL
jgi:hypothetical protein